MDIENIIRKIVDRNFSTYEQERLTVLNALMGNIDILMNSADEWFGEKIPEEYSRVIRSLFSLSAFLLEKKQNSLEVSRIDKYQEICIYSFLKQFVSELKNILDFGDMHIIASEEDQEMLVRTSSSILRESFYNIFFSVYPFMKTNSSCRISLVKSRLNISIEFSFDKLSPAFPGVSEIKKNVYTYRQGDFDKIGIGIDSAIVSLRSSGAIVRVNELPYKDRFSLTVMFPALDFYTGLERIRRDNSTTEVHIHEGDIILFISDPFMKLFLTDALHECGYNVLSIVPGDPVVNASGMIFKAMIIEYSKETASEIENFAGAGLAVALKIIICNQNDSINEQFLADTVKIIKPFNIEELIDRIENG